jgi:hypothetical protein
MFPYCLLLSVETFLGQYIFHHRLVSLPLVTLFGGIPSYNYIEELQNFAGSCNKTYHRTIGMPPNKVTKGRETNLWWKMYWPKKVLFLGKP